MMNPPPLRTALAALVAVMFAVLLLVIVFMLDDDTKPCPATGSPSATAPANDAPTSTTKVWPIKAGEYTISDTFDADGTNGHRKHLGVDLAAPAGTAIYAAADGVVVAAGEASGFGDWIVIDSNDGSGNKFSTVYGHMYPQDLLVSAGDATTAPDTVKAGQQIARVGSNGESSGAHLHFEVVPGGRLAGGSQIDPIPWLADAGQPGGGAPAQTTTPAPTVTTTPGPAQQAGAATDPNTTTSEPTASATATPASTTANPACGGTTTPGGGGVDNLADGTVPEEYAPWYRKAGTICPQISSAMLAAQGQAESGFNPKATSPDGAMGIAQFMPGTWPGYAADDDGTGNVSAYNPADAIMAQGRYMCAIAAHVDGWIADGTVGDVADRRVLYLAAYNAGEGAVQSSHGFPTGSRDYEVQTRPYCDRIIAAIPAFTKTLS